MREAIDRVQLLFGKAHTKLISREQAVEGMGYDGLHGASLGAVSAVLKYGLLEKVDKHVKVSERAMSILAPHNDEERQTVIHDAAFSPLLFSEIHERFLGEIPNDGKLRSFLLRKNFSSSALDRVIRSYRETMELVTEEAGGYTAAESGSPVDDGGSPVHQTPASSGSHSRPPLPPAPAGEPMRVSITTTGLEVVARLSDREEIDRLIQTLEATKLLFTPVEEAVKPSDDAEENIDSDTDQEPTD